MRYHGNRRFQQLLQLAHTQAWYHTSLWIHLRNRYSMSPVSPVSPVSPASRGQQRATDYIILKQWGRSTWVNAVVFRGSGLLEKCDYEGSTEPNSRSARLLRAFQSRGNSETDGGELTGLWGRETESKQRHETKESSASIKTLHNGANKAQQLFWHLGCCAVIDI